MSKKTLLVLLTIASFFPFSRVLAQSTLPPAQDPDDIRRRVTISLSDSDLLTAQDYQDFIARLERLAYDYQESLSEFDQYYAKKYQAVLQKMILRINKGEYCSDVYVLSADLEDMIEMLESQQDELKNNVGDRNLYKTSRRLRRELETLYDELQDEILEGLTEQAVREQVEKYLALDREKLKETGKIYAQTLLEHKELIKEIEKALAQLELDLGELDEEQLETLKELEELEGEIESWGEIDIDPTDFIIIPPATPIPEDLPPRPPTIAYGPKDRVVVLNSGETSVSKEFVDSIDVSDSDLPIYINSGTGDLFVTGWENDRVVVRFNVEITGSDEKKAINFTKEIQVKLFSNNNGIYLKTHFPSLDDPKRRIVMSRVDVRVPAVNPVICENSFGTAYISELEGGLELNSSYCDVGLRDIYGGIEAISKMKPLTVTDSEGRIVLKNSLGPITVKDCSAELDIENSSAAINVTDCDGEAVVRNTGQIRVVDHIGDITVENSNGVIQIQSLLGDVKAKNAFKPLIVEEIDGSVNLSNLCSTIDINEVSGTVEASNRFGTISGKYLNGPLQITNENGTVVLSLTDRLAGPSFVRTKFGSIHLSLEDESDVLLTATAIRGNILGTTSKLLKKEGQVTSTVITYGDGSQPLEVTAEGSEIRIGSHGDI